MTDLFTQTPSHVIWEAFTHMLQLMCEGCSYTYPPLSIARYSYIHLSELEQCRVKNLGQCFNTAAQDSNPGPLIRESEALPLSHGALRIIHSRTRHDSLSYGRQMLGRPTRAVVRGPSRRAVERHRPSCLACSFIGVSTQRTPPCPRHHLLTRSSLRRRAVVYPWPACTLRSIARSSFVPPLH